jgi:hypothetical protein
VYFEAWMLNRSFSLQQSTELTIPESLVAPVVEWSSLCSPSTSAKPGKSANSTPTHVPALPAELSACTRNCACIHCLVHAKCF